MIRKTKIFLLILISVIFADNNELFSDLNFEDAIALGKIQDKRVLVKFHANWCHFCNLMDKKTFSNEVVLKALEDYIAIKGDVNTPEGYKLARKYNVTGIPDILSFDTNGKLVYHQSGYQSPENFLQAITALSE